MKLSSLNTANPNGRFAVALLSMFCVGGALVAISVVQPPHLEMPSEPYTFKAHVGTSEEQEFLVHRAVSSEEMPETIVTPKAMYTRYRVGERYYFFSGGQLVASGIEALPKLPRPSIQAAR